MMKEKKPNILFAFFDQLSALALGKYGSTNPAKTSCIDALAERGVLFTNSYCTTPQCSPSRSSILSGLYPHRTKVVGNIHTPGTEPLSPTLPHLGSHFQENGFRTGYFGKWHLGTPVDRFGYDTSAIYGPAHDEDTISEAINFIGNKEDERPWLATVSFNLPHDVYKFVKLIEAGRRWDTSTVRLPFNFHDDLRGKPSAQRDFRDDDQGKPLASFSEEQWKSYILYYNECVTLADGLFGRMMKALEDTGQLKDTIVVFTSDHGDMLGSHRIPYKGPMMYDELVKVPLIFSGPGIPAGQLREQKTINTDLFPTLCELTGIDAPREIDGLSLKEVISNQEIKIRNHVVLQYYSKQNWTNPIRTLIDEKFKYNLYLSGEEELYESWDRNGETVNLAGDSHYTDIRRSMNERLIDWIKVEEDPFFTYKCTDRLGSPIPTKGG
jgi:arylsulfatase A-like enzyme